MIDAAVSFTKGCYTGQELVARIDSRGGNVPRPLRVMRSTVRSVPRDRGARRRRQGRRHAHERRRRRRPRSGGAADRGRRLGAGRRRRPVSSSGEGRSLKERLAPFVDLLRELPQRLRQLPQRLRELPRPTPVQLAKAAPVVLLVRRRRVLPRAQPRHRRLPPLRRRRRASSRRRRPAPCRPAPSCHTSPAWPARRRARSPRTWGPPPAGHRARARRRCCQGRSFASSARSWASVQTYDVATDAAGGWDVPGSAAAGTGSGPSCRPPWRNGPPRSSSCPPARSATSTSSSRSSANRRRNSPPPRRRQRSTSR